MATFNAIPLILGAGSGLASFLSEEGANEAAAEATQLIVQGQEQAGERAVNALREGFGQARGAIETGTTGAIGEQRDTLVRALEQINPELLSARGAQNLLNDALGVNGPEAQEQFFNQFQDDPGFQAELQDRINAVDRSAAARGQLLSGRTLQEVGDVGQRFRRGAFTDRLNRLRQAASGAPTLAQSGANLISGTGSNISNALLAQGTNLANLFTREATGVGDVQAQQAINIGNALARGALAPAQNRANTINALSRAAGMAAGGLPEDFGQFTIGGVG